MQLLLKELFPIWRLPLEVGPKGSCFLLSFKGHFILAVPLFEVDVGAKQQTSTWLAAVVVGFRSWLRLHHHRSFGEGGFVDDYVLWWVEADLTAPVWWFSFVLLIAASSALTILLLLILQPLSNATNDRKEGRTLLATQICPFLLFAVDEGMQADVPVVDGKVLVLFL